MNYNLNSGSLSCQGYPKYGPSMASIIGAPVQLVLMLNSGESQISLNLFKIYSLKISTCQGFPNALVVCWLI